MKRKFYTLDVFTDTALQGNPLAVVIDSDGLDTSHMQAIAREFNLSETVFLQGPDNPINTARVRIFTVQRELPFAGHPTIGTAILLAELRAPDVLSRGEVDVLLEETIGTISCAVWRRQDGTTQAKFALPKASSRVGDAPSLHAMAEALSLPVEALSVAGYEPAIWSAGNEFCCVPLANIAAVTAVKPNFAVWEHVFANSVYVFTPHALEADNHYHARMFWAGNGREDPATGSAVAAFSGLVFDYLSRHHRLKDGTDFFGIEQGYAMGRKSRIQLGLEIAQGTLKTATIGGAAAFVSDGTLDL